MCKFMDGSSSVLFWLKHVTSISSIPQENASTSEKKKKKTPQTTLYCLPPLFWMQDVLAAVSFSQQVPSKSKSLTLIRVYAYHSLPLAQGAVYFFYLCYNFVSQVRRDSVLSHAPSANPLNMKHMLLYISRRAIILIQNWRYLDVTSQWME